MTSMDALRAFAEVLGLELTVSDWMLVRLKDCDGMWYRAYRACITLSGYGDDDALTACPPGG